MTLRIVLVLAMIVQPISAICCALCPPDNVACGAAEDEASGGCCGDDDQATHEPAEPCCGPIRSQSDPCPSRCCETAPTAPMTPPAAPARAPDPTPMPFVCADALLPGAGILDVGRLLPVLHERTEQHHHSPQAILCTWNN